MKWGSAIGYPVERKRNAMKKKGAGIVMTIILISVCGWVAIVAFVIKPNMWVGVALCLGGGTVIGLGIIYLLWTWWFKRIPKRMR